MTTTAAQVNDRIDAWHRGSFPTAALHEALGMTAQEYEAFLHDAAAVPQRPLPAST